MEKLLKYTIAILSLVCAIEGAKVLVVFPFPGKSHSILGEGYVRNLAKAGHEVTFVTPFLNDNFAKVPNVRIIDISLTLEVFNKDMGNRINITAIMNKEVDIGDMSAMFALLGSLGKTTFLNENMQKLMNDPTEKFDVIIIEWMFMDIFAGLAAVFDCPYIWFSSIDPHSAVLRLIDESLHPAYSSDAFSTETPPFGFVTRVKELFRALFIYAYRSFVWFPVEEKQYHELLEPIVSKKGRQLPPFNAIVHNASIMLGNSHVSLGSPVRLPQNYKPIAGYHIDPEVKPLPAELQKVMDNAKNGVIYFSMGSNLKSKDLPDSIKREILQMFGELKYTIIWKFEKTLSELPKNVHILEWAPQTSILAHPNCKLFITHGGLLSTTETVHYGVPIIGIPVFGDQFININRAARKGFAKHVDLSYSLAKDLREAIEEIMSNTRYADRIKELSLIYHDRPSTPSAELVHWVEHVVKTRGAVHLRSPALNVPLYQKMFMDLAIAIIISILIAIYVIKKIFRICFPTSKSKNTSSTKKNN